MKISDNVAVVVGGSTGIGKSCVEALLEKGAKVYFGDNQENIGQEVEKIFKSKFPGKAIYRKCDVRKLNDIQELMLNAKKEFGQPKIFLNCAGIYDEINWEKCIDINLNGTIRCTDVALETMGKHRGGQGGIVVHIASMHSLQPYYWAPVYDSTKCGILGLTRCWGSPENFAITGVRFNCICPAAVDTPMPQSLVPGARPEHHQDVFDLQASLILEEIIRPAVVAEGFVKLIEEDEHNGRAMRITETYGTDFATFAEYVPA